MQYVSMTSTRQITALRCGADAFPGSSMTPLTEARHRRTFP
jgi:hypothetical protein